MALTLVVNGGTSIRQVYMLEQGLFLRDFPATDANGFFEILSYWPKFLELWEIFGIMCKIPRDFD